MKMQIETKFSNGDKVYRISRRKSENNYLKQAWNTEQPVLTVGRVSVEVTKSKGEPGAIGDNFKPQTKYKESYMCEETGIDSGYIYRGEDLFLIKEDAQAECDERNDLNMQ